MRDVDHVAVNQDSRANLLRKLGYVLAPAAQHPRWCAIACATGAPREGLPRSARQGVPAASASRATLHQVEHHLAHLSSAFHVSPFEEAVVVSVDGFGDFASAAWGVGQGTDIRIDGRVYFPHSLGIFYQALTQYLGFPHYGDEYKVMGLAPYGKPALHATRCARSCG